MTKKRRAEETAAATAALAPTKGATRAQIQASIRSRSINLARWQEQFGPDDPRCVKLAAAIEASRARLQ